NPFYRVVRDVLLLPMVVLAPAATVIASQAVITGAYSLVRQAIQLGLLPRLTIRHTSESQAGQIYIPRVTGALLLGVLLLVGLFRTSSALASAYGIAVATTMVVDGLLGFIVIWKFWHWPLWRVGLLIAPLVVVDVVFFTANLLKLFEGAWAPILFGASMVLLILTWRRGTHILARKTRRTAVPPDTLLASLQKHPPHIVPGTAVFLTSQPEFAPTALLHNLKHNKVLHERNVILTIVTTDTPRVADDERIKITERSSHFSLMALKFGYMESPNVPKALALARKQGWPFDIMSTSFFLSRRALKPATHSGMPRWQDHLFIGLAKSASDATDFFHIPTGRVVEVGTQVAVLPLDAILFGNPGKTRSRGPAGLRLMPVCLVPLARGGTDRPFALWYNATSMLQRSISGPLHDTSAQYRSRRSPRPGDRGRSPWQGEGRRRVLGAHARHDRRRLRRHRHEPALCDARVRAGGGRRGKSGE